MHLFICTTGGVQIVSIIFSLNITCARMLFDHLCWTNLLVINVFQVNVGCVPKKVQSSLFSCSKRLTFNTEILTIQIKFHVMWNPAPLLFFTGYVECCRSCRVSPWSQWLRLWRGKCSFYLGVSYSVCWCLFHFLLKTQWALLKPVLAVPGADHYQWCRFLVRWACSLFVPNLCHKL